MFKWWPLMWKSDHEAVHRENYTLRDALREANHLVRTQRTTIVQLRMVADMVKETRGIKHG